MSGGGAHRLTEQFPFLLRGDTAMVCQWLAERSARRAAFHCLVIFVGCGAFGAAIGVWRSEWQALFAGLKLPLVVLLTAFGNALLNGMLAPLLGVNFAFRQSFQAILMSFTVAAAVLGAFSPLIFFVIWNLPPLTPGAGITQATYSFIMLLEVAVIAFAGVAANLRLYQVLFQFSQQRRNAYQVLFSWLVGNLFLGSQLSWILRPFIGSPNLEVQFLRPDAFRSNFYEAVFHALQGVFSIY